MLQVDRLTNIVVDSIHPVNSLGSALIFAWMPGQKIVASSVRFVGALSQVDLYLEWL